MILQIVSMQSSPVGGIYIPRGGRRLISKLTLLQITTSWHPLTTAATAATRITRSAPHRADAGQCT